MTETTDPNSAVGPLPRPGVELFTMGPDGLEQHDTLEDSDYGRSWPVVQVEHVQGRHVFCVPAEGGPGAGATWTFEMYDSGTLVVRGNGMTVASYPEGGWRSLQPLAAE